MNSDSPDDEEAPDAPESVDDEVIEREEPFDVVNEFAHAELCKIYTPKGERLEIRSPKRGFSIRLDAVELESLSWQDKDTFSELLEEPLGPED